MKKKIFANIAAVALLLGTVGIFSSCQGFIDAVLGTEDKPVQQQPTTTPTVDITTMENELVGFWWEEYDYTDVTETGETFNRVLLAVSADDDHTGCIYLGVFANDTSEQPLAVYGGYEDAGFTWKLLEDGRIQLGDPETGETYTLTRTRGDGNSYGNNMTNVSNTKMTYSNGSVTVTNGSTTAPLSKATEAKAEEIEQKLSTKIKSNVGLKSIGKAPEKFSENDIR